MIKVSVIIPMYNAEPYIMQCLESVLRQTYQCLEILIVDDGSTDRSLDICREFSSNDRRIKLLSQERKGVSSARNRGMEEASGKYIFFLDSDDVIHPCLLEQYVRKAESHQIEFVFCICMQLDDLKMEEETGRISGENLKGKWEFGEKEESGEWFHCKFEQELSRIGGKMIRRDAIGKRKFDEGLSRGEDTIFIHSLASKGMRMAYLDGAGYFYRIHQGSLTHFDGKNQKGQDLQACERIKMQEYEMGHTVWALKWDKKVIWGILSDYLKAKRKKDKENGRYLKNKMALEIRHPLYREFPGRTKFLFYVLFYGCSYCPPFRALWRLKQRFSGTSV